MKQEAKEEKKDIATEAEENDVRTVARGLLVVGDVGQDRDRHQAIRGGIPERWWSCWKVPRPRES